MKFWKRREKPTKVHSHPLSDYLMAMSRTHEVIITTRPYRPDEEKKAISVQMLPPEEVPMPEPEPVPEPPVEYEPPWKGNEMGDVVFDDGRGRPHILTRDDVMRIRKKHKNGVSYDHLARLYKCSPATIMNAVRGIRSYRNF